MVIVMVLIGLMFAYISVYKHKCLFQVYWKVSSFSGGTLRFPTRSDNGDIDCYWFLMVIFMVLIGLMFMFISSLLFSRDSLKGLIKW